MKSGMIGKRSSPSAVQLLGEWATAQDVVVGVSLLTGFFLSSTAGCGSSTPVNRPSAGNAQAMIEGRGPASYTDASDQAAAMAPALDRLRIVVSCAWGVSSHSSKRDPSMALKSPRFVSSQRLQRASENNRPISRGEHGEAVRILQKALLDTGLPMPISTRKYGSPDGIYEGETVATVREFQAKHKLVVDGVTGRQTLMKLDQLLPTAGTPLPPLPFKGFTHKVHLHLRSIDMPHVTEMRQLKVMQEVFAQYGIGIEMASGESVKLTPGEQLTLTVVDGDCKWDQVSDEQRLLQNTGSKQNVGPNDITVYFATTLKENNGSELQGCAGHAPERPAVMIASTAVDKTTMAHEVCHVLLGPFFRPVHDADSNNLMCSAPICTGSPAYLNDAQLKAIRSSRFLIKIQ